MLDDPGKEELRVGSWWIRGCRSRVALVGLLSGDGLADECVPLPLFCKVQAFDHPAARADRCFGAAIHPVCLGGIRITVVIEDEPWE